MVRAFKVMIRCPFTRRNFDTGIRTSGREALSSSIYQDGKVNCHYCNQLHSLEDSAFLDVDKDLPAGALWRPNA